MPTSEIPGDGPSIVETSGSAQLTVAVHDQYGNEWRLFPAGPVFLRNVSSEEQFAPTLPPGVWFHAVSGAVRFCPTPFGSHWRETGLGGVSLDTLRQMLSEAIDLSRVVAPAGTRDALENRPSLVDAVRLEVARDPARSSLKETRRIHTTQSAVDLLHRLLLDAALLVVAYGTRAGMKRGVKWIHVNISPETDWVAPAIELLFDLTIVGSTAVHAIGDLVSTTRDAFRMVRHG